MRFAPHTDDDVTEMLGALGLSSLDDLFETIPKTVRLEILTHGRDADAYMTPTDGKPFKVAAQALKEAYRQEPVFIREGGTLPILPMFKRVLGADSLMLGFASPYCNAHGPNEKVRIPDLDLGAESIARLFAHLA